MNETNYVLLKYIYGKFNELESLKKLVEDEATLKIIQAKQDTLNDMEKVVKSEITQNVLNL